MLNLDQKKGELVSIVISTYNYGDFICETLDALKEQTYLNIEVIIIDDYSSDDTEIIIKKWYKANKSVFKNFLYLKLPRNCYTEWALNIGFAFARGDYIVIHDADDISHKKKIDKQVNFLKAQSDAAAVGTGYWVFKDNIMNSKDGDCWISFSRENIEKNYKEEMKHCVCFGTIMFRPRVFNEIVGCRRVNNGANDVFFISDIVKSDYIVENIKEKLFYVRNHDRQISKKLNLNKFYKPNAFKTVNERVSVVIPLENYSKNILNTIKSIGNQTYEDIEIIIIDNALKVSMKQAIKEKYWDIKENQYKSNIKDLIYFRLPQKVNYSSLLNIGAYLCKGEYIAFHGSNGISSSEKIEKQVKFLKNNSMYGGVGTNFNGDNSYVKYDEDIEYSYIVDYMPCVNINTIMIRSHIINKTAGLNQNISFREDFEFIYRILKNGYMIQNLRSVLYFDK